MITIIFESCRDDRPAAYAANPDFFADDRPLGPEADERSQDYVAAVAADAALYSAGGCESHLWIG